MYTVRFKYYDRVQRGYQWVGTAAYYYRGCVH